jgi:hypothetical protein
MLNFKKSTHRSILKDTEVSFEAISNVVHIPGFETP